jgi:hypothetical protein
LQSESGDRGDFSGRLAAFCDARYLLIDEYRDDRMKNSGRKAMENEDQLKQDVVFG